jgi:Sensors of blue-light using FAD
VCSEALHVAYISHRSPGVSPAAFQTIARISKSRNHDGGVHGVLLSDGPRYFQWLHGPRAAVTDLMGQILLDSRHRDIKIHFEQTLPARSLAPHWRSGYVEPAALDEFASIEPDNPMLILAGMARLIACAELVPFIGVCA